MEFGARGVGVLCLNGHMQVVGYFTMPYGLASQGHEGESNRAEVIGE